MEGENKKSVYIGGREASFFAYGQKKERLFITEPAHVWKNPPKWGSFRLTSLLSQLTLPKKQPLNLTY
jgi:hypothetical protein